MYEKKQTGTARGSHGIRHGDVQAADLATLGSTGIKHLANDWTVP